MLAARSDGHLTDRQLEVLALLATGLRYSEVATELSISARQVQRHAAQAVERVGAINVCQLIAMTIEEGHI